MAGWFVVLLAALAVAAMCAVLLFVVGMVGATRKVSTGPTVILGRALFVVVLVAVVVALGAGLWGVVAGALATLS